MKAFKKIFALMIIAIMATTLLVACDKNETIDDDDFTTALSQQQTALNDYESKLAEYKTALENQQKAIEEYQAKMAEYKTALENQQISLEEYQAKMAECEANLSQALATLDKYQKYNDVNYSLQCYDKVKYIDENLSDRDCIAGENFVDTQEWIQNTLLTAGYTEEAITLQTIEFTKIIKETSLADAIAEYTTDGNSYNRKGVITEGGEYVKATIKTDNIVVKKQGKSDKQIIVGAHYDGDGTGDNGSGIAVALTAAEKIANTTTPYTIVFIFFTAEEYGCYGSTYYADNMSDEEVNNTLYMINLDSLICGDYCYLYGGVQDDETQTVTATEAYQNAMNVAKSLGLEFKSNPWTYASPAPGYETPDYASPSTGDWSDHVGFKNKGIQYVYFEATNWEIPGPNKEYDGYGETYLIGMLMNTQNDYLEYIETYFPDRPIKHLYNFITLLNALLLQKNVNI